MSELRRNSDLQDDAARPYSFSIAVSRTNPEITQPLLDGACGTLKRHGARDDAIRVVEVPGAFELPMTAARLAAAAPSAVICLGALIKGETPHFDYLCSTVAHGIQEVAVRSGVPAIFGVLTCESQAHAAARAGGEKGNKGSEAALAAIEMAALYAALAGPGA